MKARQKLLATAIAFALPLAASAQATPATPPEATPTAPAAEPPAPKPAPKPPEAPKLATLYGTLNVNLQYTDQSKGTTAPSVKSRYAVSTDSTNIGVRGAYDLRPGYGATYQCETSANIDGISVSGICNRNSRVGITIPYGTIFYGTWDTPFKAANYGTKAEDPFGQTDVYGFNALLGSPGFNYRSSGWVTANGTATATSGTATTAPTAGSSIHGFDVRSNNSVGFHSAKIQGVSFKVQYSTDEFANADGSLSPRLFGAVVNYDVGPLSVYGAYEYHEDAAGLATINPGNAAAGTRPFGATVGNPSNLSSSDWAWRAGAGYELASEAGTTRVSAMIDQLTFGQDQAATGALKEYKRIAWYAGISHRWTDHELRFRYSMADSGDCKLIGGASCSTSDFGASEYVIGYAYHLAKTAQVYAFYAKIQNDANAQYTFSIGGAPGVAGATNKGADPQAGGLGVRVAF
jgi:hypothetical protein